VKQKAVQLAIIPLKQQTHPVKVTGFYPEHYGVISQRIQTLFTFYMIGNFQKK